MIEKLRQAAEHIEPSRAKSIGVSVGTAIGGAWTWIGENQSSISALAVLVGIAATIWTTWLKPWFSRHLKGPEL